MASRVIGQRPHGLNGERSRFSGFVTYAPLETPWSVAPLNVQGEQFDAEQYEKTLAELLRTVGAERAGA